MAALDPLPPLVVEFNTCTFNDGKDFEDLNEIRDLLNSLINHYEKQNGPSYYHYRLLDYAGEIAPEVNDEPAKKLVQAISGKIGGPQQRNGSLGWSITLTMVWHQKGPRDV